MRRFRGCFSIVLRVSVAPNYRTDRAETGKGLETGGAGANAPTALGGILRFALFRHRYYKADSARATSLKNSRPLKALLKQVHSLRQCFQA